jgi:CxxC-x17-CxxC domain-containing protein
MKDFNKKNRFGKNNQSRFDNNPSSRFSKDDHSQKRGNFNQFDREERPSFKKSFNVTCAQCGDECDVPFKPTGNKPVFCSNCYRKENKFGSRPQSSSRNDLDEINAKLDKIMEALDIE